MSDYLKAEQYEYARKTGDWESGKVLTHGQALNSNQQVVLEWLKRKRQEGSQPIECLYTLAFGDAIESVIIAYINLTESEQFQVLAAFAEWGSSNL